ncbi:MAG: hypothetical protein QM539_05380 [Alphaproteobacteria bacterium]|nr:hypothetical protein [Alphaproteobacteria bacterium]
MKQFFNPKYSILIGMMLIAGLWRVFISAVNYPFLNFTPVGAMAIFGGCYFAKKWQAYFWTLLTIFISDVFLNLFIYSPRFSIFYDGFYWVYGSFALTVFLGTFIKKVQIKSVFFTAIGAALLHWIITDFGVWYGGSLYPRDFNGLTTCFTLALPFLKNMIVGNVVFSALLFFNFEFVAKKMHFVTLNP